MRTAPQLPRPTEAELELLNMLWENGPATVRDLHQAISVKRAIGYTSVLKLLQIMTDKGLVEREESGKAHIYRPVGTRQQTQSQMVRDISERVFSGSAAALAMHALSTQPVSDQELDELRRLIEQKRKQP
ncbi:MAG TPA: BlaI/MecI/CopY family transcriptional regulator [Acidobacteriaceae bacterium]|nr:BlaI/MecI/CopY family transcriptional regulator [Acidobacteriaceae bacterium]